MINLLSVVSFTEPNQNLEILMILIKKVQEDRRMCTIIFFIVYILFIEG